MFYLRIKLQNRENYPQGTIDSLWKGNPFHRKGCTSLEKTKLRIKGKSLYKDVLSMGGKVLPFYCLKSLKFLMHLTNPTRFSASAQFLNVFKTSKELQKYLSFHQIKVYERKTKYCFS